MSPGVVETEFSFAMNPGNPEKAEKLYSSMLCIQVGFDVFVLVLELRGHSNNT